MSGYECYKIYVAIKAHFTSPSYEYHKHSGRTSANPSSYERRKDRYQFESLGIKYNKEKLVDLFVANFVIKPYGWVGELLLDEAEEIHLEWQKRVESLTYFYTDDCDGILNWLETNQKKLNDLFRVIGDDHPIIVKMVLQNVISLETFITLDKVFGFIARIARRIDDPIWKNLKHKSDKYSPFLNIDVAKCRRILRDKIEKEYVAVK